MLELFVYIILFLLITILAGLIHYWYSLLFTREMVSRHDLFSYRDMLIKEIRFLNFSSYGAVFIPSGIIVSWLITGLGGLLSFDASPSPDYCENSAANYFFQSAAFPFLLYFLLPSIRELSRNINYIYNMLSLSFPLLFSMSVSFMAIQIMSWGVHHEISFLFILADIPAFIILIILAFRTYCKVESDMEDSVNTDDYNRDSAAEDWNKNTKDGLNDDGELDI